MPDSDRFRLLSGPYKAPRFRYGQVVSCAVRGEVVIVGLSAGRIPWPIGQRRGTSARSLVVFAGLARGVRKESNQAVCHWWGVTPQAVSLWRKALDVGRATKGTKQLWSDAGETDYAARGRKRAHAKAQDPERRAKIAASKIGKPRPRHVTEAMRKGRTGKPQSAEARQKMSVAARRRGARPPKAGSPWTVEEDALLFALPVAEVATRTGRTRKAVYDRRHELGGETEGGRNDYRFDG